MRPTTEEITKSVERLGALKFFPADPAARVVVMDLLRRMCGEKEHLTWLIYVLINHVGEWPGPAQMRALYATRFKPADGDEGPYCTIAGFTPVEAEAKFYELEGTRHQRQLESWKDENKMLRLMEAKIKRLQ